MNLLDFKNKLIKGKELGGEVVYIKEDNIISGIGSVYKSEDGDSVTLLKSKEESVKVNDFIKILDDLNTDIGDIEVFIGTDNYTRANDKEIKSIEFAQYETIKMIFINV